MRERDIKAKPSVTKSPPHQASFAPQEELPQRAAALLRPVKRPALQPCARRHHLTPGDIGAATAAALLHLNAWQNLVLQPCVCCRHVTPGTLALQPPLHRCVLTPGKMPGAVAMCAPPPRHTWGYWRCSHRCAATS
jgi:hypothetical protein